MATDKRIEDYLHLYLGCEVDWDGSKCKLFGVHKAYCVIEFTGMMIKLKLSEAKPILRPLSDMSEQEKNYCNIQQPNPEYFKNSEQFSFEQTRYLLSKHFDLFGLIEAGLAIDKSTLK